MKHLLLYTTMLLLGISTSAQEDTATIHHRKKIEGINFKTQVKLKEKTASQQRKALSKLKKGKQELSKRSQHNDSADSDNTIELLSLDYPSREPLGIEQLLRYKLDKTGEARIRIQLIQARVKDTATVYDIAYDNVSLKKGANTLCFKLSREGEKKKYDYSFFEIISKYDLIPPGIYTANIYIAYNDTDYTIQESFYWEIDSMLSDNSILKQKLNNEYLPENKTFDEPSRLKNKKRQAREKLTNNEAVQFVDRLNKKLGKQNGVHVKPELKAGSTYSALYYKCWFLGRYELAKPDAMKQKISRENMLKLANPSSMLVKNDITGFTGINQQVKGFYKSEDKKKENNRGEIDLGGYFSNGQEPGSMQGNNYQEYRGNLHTRIFNMPIVVEGFYTSQDKNREAKASYFRLSYDASGAKNELSKKVGTYKNTYNETKAKGNTIESIYQGYIFQLTGEASNIMAGLFSEYGIDAQLLQKYNGNINALIKDWPGNIDTTALLKRAYKETGERQPLNEKKEKLQKNKEAIEDKVSKVNKAKETIGKYQKQIQQYKSAMYFDSAQTFSKLSELSGKTDVSHKQLAKASREFLPATEHNSFKTGLTHFELGMINRFESNYTMAGQLLKGGAAGYDWGHFTTSVSIGKTEYISRDGNLDRYNSYLGRIDMRPIHNQKAGLIYYNYSPTRQMSKSDNFKHDAIQANPIVPVHIFSLVYSGIIAKNLSVQAEGASSFKKNEPDKDVTKQNSAWITSVEYYIPIASAVLKGEWEHLGKDFENNALPYMKASTERYTLEGTKRLFKSFISVGLQYNFLKQENFSTTGYNRKWGFNIRTHTKRYPEIYLSYKPYSTFRTFHDTLSIPQRPLVGEVWLARGSYQIQKGGNSHRFVFLYNKNNSTLDTQSYSINTLQAGYIYTNRSSLINASIGRISLPASDIAEYYSGNSYFINVMYSRRVTDNLNMNLGQDVSFASFGLQRTATNAGGIYQFIKLPLALRLQMRYANFRQNISSGNKSLWSGHVGINLKFGRERMRITRYGNK